MQHVRKMNERFTQCFNCHIYCCHQAEHQGSYELLGSKFNVIEQRLKFNLVEDGNIKNCRYLVND